MLLMGKIRVTPWYEINVISIKKQAEQNAIIVGTSAGLTPNTWVRKLAIRLSEQGDRELQNHQRHQQHGGDAQLLGDPAHDADDTEQQHHDQENNSDRRHLVYPFRLPRFPMKMVSKMNRKMPATIAVGKHGIWKICWIQLPTVKATVLGGDAAAADNEMDVKPGILIGSGKIARCGIKAASI